MDLNGANYRFHPHSSSAEQENMCLDSLSLENLFQKVTVSLNICQTLLR